SASPASRIRACATNVRITIPTARFVRSSPSWSERQDSRQTIPPSNAFDKLEALLAMSASRIEGVAPLFSALRLIPFGERYPPLALSPTQQRRRTLAALATRSEPNPNRPYAKRSLGSFECL